MTDGEQVIRMESKTRRYAFDWDFLGDVDGGRPILGSDTSIEAYRLFLYTLRDVLEQKLGTEEADTLVYAAGKLAGEHFCRRFLNLDATLPSFLDSIQANMLKWKMGILRVEESQQLDDGRLRFVLTVAEDVDCSGLPERSFGVCTYDEGFIHGILSTYTGKAFQVKEVDCWCTGDRTCRFEAVSE